MQTESYLLACQRHIELNPVRAAMVEHPADYRWSSYRANAQGETDALVSPHEICLGLANEPALRQAASRELFRCQLEPALIDEIRQATNGNFALGSALFGEQVAAALGRRAQPRKAGRPRKVSEPASEAMV